MSFSNNNLQTKAPNPAPRKLARTQKLGPRKLRNFFRELEKLGSLTAACGRARISSRNLQQYLADGRKAIEAGVFPSRRTALAAWIVLMVEDAVDRWEANTLDRMDQPLLSNALLKSLVFRLERLRTDVYRPRLTDDSDAARRLMFTLQTRGDAVRAEIVYEEGSFDARAASDRSASPRMGARSAGWLAFEYLPNDLLITPESLAQPDPGHGTDSPGGDGRGGEVNDKAEQDSLGQEQETEGEGDGDGPG